MKFPEPVDFAAEEATIDFHAEDVAIPPELDPDRWQDWIRQIINENDAQLVSLTYIFCSDAYLHRINVEYLQHDTYTDIITFPYQEPPFVESDIYISVERVRDNAQSLQEPFVRELARVVIHGVLHLMGQGDKSAEEAQQMRLREDAAITQLLGK